MTKSNGRFDNRSTGWWKIGDRLQ